MKKIMLIAAVALMVTGTTSCFKTYVCECRSTLQPTLNINYTLDLTSKKNAKATCENYGFDYPTDPTYACELQ